MKIYADHMVRSSEALNQVVNTMSATARAFSAMIEDAFETVDFGTTSLVRLAKAHVELERAENAV